MELELSYLNEARTWSLPGDVKHVLDDLCREEGKVTTLRLTGNTLGVEAAETLAEPLKKQDKISKAIFSDLFTNRGKDVIGRALKALSLGLMYAKVNLVELDLSDNAFGPNGVVGVTGLIASECCYTLKVLNMNNEGLGHQGCKALVEAMKIARINSNKNGLNLEVFIAGRNRLENVGMEMLASVFGDGMTSLKKLVLLQNGIGVHGIKGIESIVAAIRNHIDLEILNISDNNIKSNGMDLLSNVIPDLKKLKELYLNDCLLKSQGAKIFSIIAEDRVICPNLKIISLSGNEIKGTEALLIVNAILDGKPAIEKIDLRENEISKSKLNDIHCLLTEYEKEYILEKDEEGSDEESEGDENSVESSSDSDDGAGSDGAGDYSEEECNEDDELSKDSIADYTNDAHTNYLDKNPTSEVTTSNLFTTTNSVKTAPSRLIAAHNGNTPINTNSGLFSSSVTCVTGSSIFSQQSSGLFTKSAVPQSISNLFGTPVKNINIFKTNTGTSGLFGTPLKDDNIFKASSGSSSLFGTPVKGANIFKTTYETSSLFGNPMKDSNIFKQTEISKDSPRTNLFNPNLFSFAAAAKQDVIKDGIIPCLKYENLMDITRSALKLTDASILSKTIEKDIHALIENSPANAVRIAMILCEEEKTFDFGISMISHLLLSSKWSPTTNAILVEMNCIKSEEKRFVPICNINHTLPVSILKKVLDVENLPQDVKINLSTVLRNLSKDTNPEIEDFLNVLNENMNKLSI